MEAEVRKGIKDQYRRGFEYLQDITPRVIKAADVIDSAWNEIDSVWAMLTDFPESKEGDSYLNHWPDLLSSLADRYRLDSLARENAQKSVKQNLGNLQKLIPVGSVSGDPGFMAMVAEENRFRSLQQEARQANGAAIVRAVSSMNGCSAIINAQVLWNEVLNPHQKNRLRETRELFFQGLSLAAEADPIIEFSNSYEVSVYRTLIDRFGDRNYPRDYNWTKVLQAARNPFSDTHEAIIGKDYVRLDLSGVKGLNHKPISIGDPSLTVVERCSFNDLLKLLTGVSIVLLRGKIIPDNESHLMNPDSLILQKKI